MILWLNGAFGAGKTVTAAELHRRLPDSFVYDPENTGFFLRKNTPGAVSGRYTDFQDDPLWRSFNLALLTEIARAYPGMVIVPMTVVSPQYYDELIGGLRRAGIEVHHIILGTTPAVLRRRQRSRLDFSSSWAAQQTERCLAALSAPPFEGFIDTSALSIAEAAEAVAASAGLMLQPRGSFLRQTATRLMAQLRALRF